MPDTEKNEEMLKNINDNSLEVLEGFAEKAVLKCKPEQKFQFQRLGYYIVDKKSDKSNIIFNKTVSLREKRISRNPKTGTSVLVEEKSHPYFRASKNLKESLNK